MGPREDREREKRSDAMTAARAYLWHTPTGKPVDQVVPPDDQEPDVGTEDPTPDA